MVHKKRRVNFLTMVGKLEASTVCLRESTRRVQLSGKQAAVDRVLSSHSRGVFRGGPNRRPHLNSANISIKI